MGKRAVDFEKALRAAGYDVLTTDERRARGEVRATTRNLPATVRTEVIDLYRSLGGVRDDEDFTAGPWDIACADGLLIEFDEDLHFNRYRQSTLQNAWSGDVPWTSDYGRYCADYEDMCLKAGRMGGKWTSPSTEAMFGGSDPAGTFDREGAARWKQRALYDAVRDIYALHAPGVSLARVCIHDRIDGVELNKALKSGAGLNPDGLRELIDLRTSMSL